MAITKNTCRNLRTDLNAALESIREKYGLTIEVGNMTYTSSDVNVKISAFLPSSEAGTKEAKAFLDKCFMYNLKKDDLGKEFVSDTGERHKIVGLAPSRKKYPILTRNLSKAGPGDEATNCFTMRSVVEALGRAI